MAHKHSVYDSDTHFSINPITRALKNESSAKTMVMQYDHNSERFTFEIPRYIEGHDMMECNSVQVHYINIDNQNNTHNDGVYEVDDLQISPEDENIVILSWLVSQNATQLVGNLNFRIHFACVTDGVVEYAWNTAIFKGISVSDGIYNSDVIVQQYADILEAWERRIFLYDDDIEEMKGDIKTMNSDVSHLKDTATAIQNDIADLKYKEITINTFTNSVNTAEIGSTVDEVKLNWATNKTPASLTLDGEAVSADLDSAKLTGLGLTADKTWTLKAVDERNAIATKTTAVKFLNGVYYGVGAIPTEINSEFVLGLTKTLTTTKSRKIGVNAGDGEYIWYCVPVRFGACAFNVGGFDGGFDLAHTIDFTNASGYTEQYYIYRSANAGLGSTTVEVI